MGTRALRCPGGSLSDEYHWSTDTNLTNRWQWPASFANFVHVPTNAGVQVFTTVNYGTGSTNEAAAWVALASGGSDRKSRRATSRTQFTVRPLFSL